MSNTQMKVSQAPAAIGNRAGALLEPAPEPAPQSPRQDFAFAVKLFGIAGLVVLAIWLMNRAVG